MSFRLLLVATFLVLVPSSNTHAQIPCRYIVTFDDVYNEESDEYEPQEIRTPIEDCNDPFVVTTDPPNPFSVVVNGEAIAPGAVVSVPVGSKSSIGYVGLGLLEGVDTLLFRHDGNDYRFINQVAPEAVESDFRQFAETYFATPAQRDLYVRIMVKRSAGEDITVYIYDEEKDETIFDVVTGERVFDVFDKFSRDFFKSFSPTAPPVDIGTYTLVLKEFQLSVSRNTFWESLRSLIIPTAYAQCSTCFEFPVYAITFTIAEAPPEPTGASSVLFLPGIQASRLYSGEDISIPGFGNDKSINERLWEPGRKSDVLALEMNSDGKSVNNIYTKDIIDKTNLELLFGYSYEIGDIYAGISSFLDQQVIDEKIASWVPYAYDWRHDVFSVVEEGVIIDEFGTRLYLEQVIDDLADGSLSGKVTIVAHSNGGLLAKALMIALEKAGKEELIDTIVLVGSPQIGTPKAIGVLLHGYDQELGGGLVVDAISARKVINNLPGAYGLLPTTEYLRNEPEPVISFNDSAPTFVYRSLYGDTINSYAEYQSFLNTGATFIGINEQPIYEPMVTNEGLFLNSQLQHEELTNWVAPDGVRMIEIVGIGLPTPRGFVYEGLEQVVCEDNFFLNTTTCTRENSYRPLVQMSVFGDGTVMGQSAEAYKHEKETYYVDLLSISAASESVKFNHANMTETLQVQNLVFQTLFSDSVTVPQNVFASRPINTEVGYTIEQIASPVQISTKDPQGRVTGVVEEGGEWIVKTEIPGSQYFEFAKVKYLVVPSSSGDRVTSLVGTGQGGYSYLIDEVYPGITQTRKQQIINATTTPTMKAEVIVKAGTFGDVNIDYDGDGVLDAITRWNGESETLVQEPAVGEGTESPPTVLGRTSSQSSGTRIGDRNSSQLVGVVAGLSINVEAVTEEHKRIYLILQKLQKVLDLYILMQVS